MEGQPNVALTVNARRSPVDNAGAIGDIRGDLEHVPLALIQAPSATLKLS
jgi:hypothetical protein